MSRTQQDLVDFLGEPSLNVTHFHAGKGRLVGTVNDDTGYFAVVTDGVSSLYVEHDTEAGARRSTTGLALSYLLNDREIF